MIKATRTETKVDEYPYLATTGRTVILVTGKNRDRELVGMVVKSFEGSCFPIGNYSTAWNADELKRCNDIITLQNV